MEGVTTLKERSSGFLVQGLGQGVGFSELGRDLCCLFRDLGPFIVVQVMGEGGG